MQHDDRLRVRLPTSSLKPKRDMSIDSMLDAKTEDVSLVDSVESPDELASRSLRQAPTTVSVLDDNNDSIVSFEQANLNTTFNLSSFASTTEAMSSVVLNQNLTLNRSRRKEADTMPETVKEVSRESDESLNDRSS